MTPSDQPHPSRHGAGFWIVGAAVALMSVGGSLGCQVDMGGQTLPSAYYMYDDIQYFEPGPEFKLSKEAAAMKAFSAQREGRAP